MKKSMENLKEIKNKINEIAKNGKMSPEDLLSLDEVYNKAVADFDNILSENKKLSESNENLKNHNYSLLMRVAYDTNQDSKNDSAQPSSQETVKAPEDIFNEIASNFLNPKG